MTLSDLVDGFLRDYRGYYPYRLIRDLDDQSDKHRYALMFIHELDSRYPGYNMHNVREILRRCSPESYMRTIRNQSVIFYLPDTVKSSLFNNADYKESMIQLYQQAVKPKVERFRSYERQLDALTRMFVCCFSEKELAEFAELYGAYKELDGVEKQYFLGTVNEDYVPFIRAIDHFERTYRDILENDVAVVRDRLNDKFGFGDGLKDGNYGILFPYLHLTIKLNSMLEKKLASDSFSYIGYN